MFSTWQRVLLTRGAARPDSVEAEYLVNASFVCSVSKPNLIAFMGGARPMGKILRARSWAPLIVCLPSKLTAHRTRKDDKVKGDSSKEENENRKFV